MSADAKGKKGSWIAAVSSVVTVVAAVSLLGLGILAMRKPAVVIAATTQQPEPKVSFRNVPVTIPAAKPPVVVPVQLKTVPVIPEVPEDTTGPWTGIWKTIRRASLPMLEIHKRGERYFGRYAPPDWSGSYDWKDGIEKDGKLEFSVMKHTQERVQFRLELLANGDAKCVNWLKLDDAMIMVNNSIKLARNAREAYELRLRANREIIRLGEEVPLATFRRVTEPGEKVAGK